MILTKKKSGQLNAFDLYYVCGAIAECICIGILIVKMLIHITTLFKIKGSTAGYTC